MEGSGGSRITWTDLPDQVRDALEGALGSPVVDAVDQSGGFSPGLAARCTLADGRRVFVKAVSPDQNPDAADIHRREAAIAGQLTPDVPAPRLRHVHDDGHWVALAFDEVDGVQPREPWQLDQLDLVVPALVAFARDATPSPVRGIPLATEALAATFGGWRRLADGDGDPSSYGPEVIAAVPALADREDGWADAAAGDALVHGDLRADNLLIDADGDIWLVDWPWACIGHPLLDLAGFLPSVGLGGGPGIDEVLRRHDVVDDTDAFEILLTAIAGFFVRSSLDPAPPGLPRLRDFQRAQADVALAWLLPRVPGR